MVALCRQTSHGVMYSARMATTTGIAAPPRTDLTQTVATNVRAIAAARGFSASAIGRHIGLAQGAVSLKWRGLRAWTLTDLDRIADLLQVPPSSLLVPNPVLAPVAGTTKAPAAVGEGLDVRPEGFEPPTF